MPNLVNPQLPSSPKAAAKEAVFGTAAVAFTVGVLMSGVAVAVFARNKIKSFMAGRQAPGASGQASSLSFFGRRA